MHVKTQIINALMMYDKNEYTTQAFCDVFAELYYFSSSGHRFFQGAEKKALDKLAFYAERYTECEEDAQAYPMYYKNEAEFRSVFNQVKQLFIFKTD